MENIHLENIFHHTPSLTHSKISNSYSSFSEFKKAHSKETHLNFEYQFNDTATGNENLNGNHSNSSLSKRNILDKLPLLRKDKLNSVYLKKWLYIELEESINYFSKDSNESKHLFYDVNFLKTNEANSRVYHQLTSYAKSLLQNCDLKSKTILENAYLFDISENIRANGYRSVVRAYDSCCRHLLMLLINMNEKKNKFFFQMTNLSFYLKELQAWVSLI